MNKNMDDNHLQSSIKLAEDAIENENYSLAREILIGILKKNPADINALNDMVVVHLLQKEYLEALAKLKDILTLDPENEVAITNIKYFQNVLDETDVEKSEDALNIQYDKNKCPCCNSLNIQEYSVVDGFQYYRCYNCELLFIDVEYLKQIDDGFNIVEYREDYWDSELPAAWERASGVALARMAETFYYARIPINSFLDIGSGPGYFLDMISKYLPDNSSVFYANEKYPPLPQHRTDSKNYLVCDLADVNIKVDAGMCIEVIEHLTPRMISELFRSLAKISNPQAVFIINTGMPSFVEREDPSYLDPKNRGHILSYSIKAIQKLVNPFGFSVIPIPGKAWAFLVEYHSEAPKNENLQDRIWTALDHNLKILSDKKMGIVLKILGLETCRAYN
jgi:SAM-dependent methyltransferase